VCEQKVSGRTTAEIEEQLAAAFHDPARLKERPNVVVTVAEYRTVSVAVIGAVNQPGLHELRHDHMTVVGALMAAGGIKTERGAKEIRVIGQDEAGQTVTRSLAVLLADIPLEDVALVGGETIVVEPPPERAFSVIGLVKKSGVFPYPAPRRYNLMQALAAAGGVDENAAPRYATIYRVKADGSVLGATFKIDGTSLEDASNVWIKDGDVIAVDHTQGSWLRSFFSQVFGFRASVNVSSSATPTL
jgi:protein involved in polysaccharide export with SLBB domain